MSLDSQQKLFIMEQGHKLHPDRSTYTHAAFWGEVQWLDGNKEITEDGEAIYIERLGRNLRVSDVLPERLALAVRSDGSIVKQSDFRVRYMQYLRGFGAHAKLAPELEHIPTVKSWLMKQLDPARPPVNGKAWYVDIGFDARRPAEVTMKAEWHPSGVKMDEWKRRHPEEAAPLVNAQSVVRDEKVKMLVEMHATGLIDDAAFKSELASIYAVGAGAAPASPGLPSTEVKAASAPTAPIEYVTSPCGTRHKARGTRMHKRHCKDPRCADAAMEAVA